MFPARRTAAPGACPCQPSIVQVCNILDLPSRDIDLFFMTSLFLLTSMSAINQPESGGSGLRKHRGDPASSRSGPRVIGDEDFSMEGKYAEDCSWII